MAPSNPTLWLVTRSLAFYPDAGAGDWLQLTADAALARRTYDEQQINLDPYNLETVHLIEVCADGTFIELARRELNAFPEDDNDS